MACEQDHFLKALEYAESANEFTIDSLAENIGLNIKDKKIKQIANLIHHKILFHNTHSNYINHYENDKIEVFFTIDDKIKLITYQSLRINQQSLMDAQKSSKQANFFATSALIISILSLLLSAGMSLFQIRSDVNLPKSFVDKVDMITENQKKQLDTTAKQITTKPNAGK